VGIVSSELTESERAAEQILTNALPHCVGLVNDALAKQVVSAVRSIIEAEITGHPDVNNMNRGFGNCPHCLSPRVAHCHECLNNIERDSAHAEGWRMDHIGGFGCIALCPACRNDNP
jgi:hypothetical protein